MPEYCAYKLSITSSPISDLFVQCIQISQIMSHVKSAPRCLSDLSGQGRNDISHEIETLQTKYCFLLRGVYAGQNACPSVLFPFIQ